MINFIISRTLIAVMFISVITTMAALLIGTIPSTSLWLGYLGVQVFVITVLIISVYYAEQ